MKSLLFIVLGVLVFNSFANSKSSKARRLNTDTLETLKLNEIFGALERDIQALCALQKKTLSEDENLDPKFFHTRTPEKKTYLQ